jgi:hypothetical protein
MKKLAVLLSVLAVAIISLFFESNKKGKRKNKNREGTVDDEMAGPGARKSILEQMVAGIS